MCFLSNISIIIRANNILYYGIAKTEKKDENSVHLPLFICIVHIHVLFLHGLLGFVSNKASEFLSFMGVW